MTVLALPSSPGALSKARWEDIVPYFDDLAERPLDETTIEGWLQSLVHAGRAGDRGGGARHDRLHHRDLRSREGSRPPPLLHRDPAQDGGAERRARAAAGGVRVPHPGARDHPGPLPDLDRDLPRGQRADLLRAGGAERAVSADHRLHDGGVGGAGAPSAPAPAVPQESRPGRAGARLPRRRRARTPTSATSWPGCSTGCTSCGSARPGTPGSPISATTSSPPSSASTTPRPTASASTTRSRRPSRPRSSACSRSAAAGSRSTCSGPGTWRWIPTARRRSGRSRPPRSSSAGRARCSAGWIRRSAPSSRR